jgi:hypothetical protein
MKGISMRAQLSFLAVVLVILAVGRVQAQQAVDAPTPLSANSLQGGGPSVGPVGLKVAPFTLLEPLPDDLGLVTAQDKDKDKGKDKGKEKDTKEKTKPPIDPKQQPVDAFAPETASLPEPSSGFNPHMLGDLPGAFSLKPIMLPVSQTIRTFQFVTTLTPVQQINPNGTITIRQVATTTQIPLTIQRVVTMQIVTHVPLASVGASKVAENQSPMPQDRGYITYNYYNGVSGPSGPPVPQQQTTFNGAPATITTATPNAPRLAIQRGVIGFEKAFLDGNASIAVRVPIFGAHGDGGFSQSDLGDVSVFLNVALYRDDAGNVFSGGLGVTTPTGPNVDTIAGNVHPWLLQPFVGYRRNLDNFYLHGFTSVAIPTDGRVVTALYNDVGAGYWLYRGDGDRLITALIPTFEVHVTTPLNHRQPTDLITVPDIVALTGGMHIGVGSRSLLTLGVVTPVTGPRPWTVEATVQLNIRF